MAVGGIARLLSTGGRFAGQAFNALKGPMTGGQLTTRLLPDVGFGIMSGAMTPGDIGDKIIAGTGQAVGGGLGGLALGRAGSALNLPEGVSWGMDFVGSYGGDYAGMWGADQVMRGKDLITGGKGQTPWERMGDAQREQTRQELEQQILWKYGLVPGTREQYARPAQDEFMIDNGLG